MGVLGLSLRASGDAWLRRRLRAALPPRPRRPLLLERESVGTRPLLRERVERAAGDGGIRLVTTVGGSVTDAAEVREGVGFGEPKFDTTRDADSVELAE